MRVGVSSQPNTTYSGVSGVRRQRLEFHISKRRGMRMRLASDTDADWVLVQVVYTF